MCGISGILDPTYQCSTQSQLQAMIDVMDHRGPDGSGVFLDGPVGLGHKRLSIIDLENGVQPMSCRNKRFWVTFNGEIYNFQEVRKELEQKGYRFKTRSDTEVILLAYEAYGEKCIEKFRGMFAFGIWDARKNSLLLARDRLGKKPLYYFYDGKKLIFASEIKSILQVSSIRRELDLDALKDYFTYLYVPFPKTIFKNIFKLPPAHFMRVQLVSSPGGAMKSVSATQGHSKGRAVIERKSIELSVEKYWDLDFRPDYSMSESDWIEGLEEKLLEAVEIRMISDVPIGAFLSGGVDSSAVVALMSHLSGTPVKTFSIGFEGDDSSEMKYARMVAERYATDHQEIIVKPDAIEMLPKLAWQYDEPFADPSAVPTYYVSKAARSLVTVALSGDGGDESFAGYGRYQNYLTFGKFDFIPEIVRKTVLGGVANMMPAGMKGKGVLYHLSRSPFDRYAGMLSHTFPGYLEDLLHDDLKACLQSTKESYGYIRSFYDGFPGSEKLGRLQYVDTKTYLAEDILTKVDRASMLCSLETRAPLLDHKLLEYISSIPAGFKLSNKTSKYIFKKTMEKYLPDELLYRDKQGFDMPLKWFKKDFLDFARGILLSDKCRGRGLLNASYLERLLNLSSRKGVDLSEKIWSLVFFEQWCCNWLD